MSHIAKNEKISVIIPVYNVENYIRRCLDSVICQTYTNLEIILIDDGSTDDSGRICDEYATKDARIIVIHKRNTGSTDSRNEGLKISTGKYVGFVDSDDWIEPVMYEILLNQINKENADVSIGRILISHEDSEYLEAERGITTGTYVKEDGIVAHNIIYSDDYKCRGISPNLCDKLFVKEKFVVSQNLVDINTRYAEDDLCVYDYLLNSKCVTFINKPLYHYYQRNGSITKKSDEQYFEKITLFYRQMKLVFSKNKYSDILIEKLNRYMLEFVLRGINTSFGFNYGNIVPFYRPDMRELSSRDVQKIVLYGAGNVGKDYYHFFKQTKVFSVVQWIDRDYKKYRLLGYNISCPQWFLDNKEYDLVIIAVESYDLAEKIKKDLMELFSIDESILWYNTPIKLIEEIEIEK